VGHSGFGDSRRCIIGLVMALDLSVPVLTAAGVVVVAPFVLVFVMWRRIRSTKGTNALRFTRAVEVNVDLPTAVASVITAMKAIGAAIEFVDESDAAVTSLLHSQFILDSTIHPVSSTRTEVRFRAWNAMEGYQGLGWDLGQSKRLIRQLVAEMEKVCPVDASDPGLYGDEADSPVV
jgi:hypothetical protein